jgi:hypothetical protein
MVTVASRVVAVKRLVGKRIDRLRVGLFIPILASSGRLITAAPVRVDIILESQRRRTA